MSRVRPRRRLLGRPSTGPAGQHELPEEWPSQGGGGLGPAVQLQVASPPFLAGGSACLVLVLRGPHEVRGASPLFGLG